MSKTRWEGEFWRDSSWIFSIIATFRKQFGVSPTKYIRNENETVRAVEALDLKEAKAKKI